MSSQSTVIPGTTSDSSPMERLEGASSAMFGQVDPRARALVRRGTTRNRRQGIFWLCTIPHENFTPYPLPGTKWIKGQLELGNAQNYLHWQVFVAFAEKKSLVQVRSLLGEGGHYELSRSEAAEAYVWKDDTAVRGTRFELKILF